MTPRFCPEKQGEHLIRWRRLENKWVWSGRNRVFWFRCVYVLSWTPKELDELDTSVSSSLKYKHLLPNRVVMLNELICIKQLELFLAQSKQYDVSVWY